MQSSGLGDGSGLGVGSGVGDGSGLGDGSGEGSGEGEGAGAGPGSGTGDGEGVGPGEGSGVGAGSGDGEGCGVGRWSGDGWGSVPAGGTSPPRKRVTPSLEGNSWTEEAPLLPVLALPSAFDASFALSSRVEGSITVSDTPGSITSAVNPRSAGRGSAGLIHARSPITSNALIPAAIDMSTRSRIE